MDSRTKKILAVVIIIAIVAGVGFPLGIIFLGSPLIAAIIFGTVQGAVLALLGLGFSLVFGVGGVLNLGHGGFYLITCYIVYVLFPYVGLPLSMIIGLVLITIIGALSYLSLIKPLQDSAVGVVIATFSMAFFVEQLIKVLVDEKFHLIPPLIPASVEFLGVSFPAQFLVAIIGSLILIVIIYLFINRSKIGKSIRAVSQDREAAKLMGINADLILMITVMISALLAGFAAVLYAPANFIAPYIGWSFLINAFAVTVFGGMGSIPGSIIGAFIMGYATTLGRYFINLFFDPLGYAFSAVLPIIIILVMLLIKPQGILGKKEIE